MNLYIFSICNYNNNNRHSKMQWHRQEITQPHLDQDLHFNILPSLSLLQFSFSRFPFPLFLSLFVFLSLYDLYTLFIFVYGGLVQVDVLISQSIFRRNVETSPTQLLHPTFYGKTRYYIYVIN